MPFGSLSPWTPELWIDVEPRASPIGVHGCLQHRQDQIASPRITAARRPSAKHLCCPDACSRNSRYLLHPRPSCLDTKISVVMPSSCKGMPCSQRKKRTRREQEILPCRILKATTVSDNHRCGRQMGKPGQVTAGFLSQAWSAEPGGGIKEALPP